MSIGEFNQHLPTLNTPHLLLRKLREEDSKDYFAFASDPRVVQHLRWGPRTSLADTRAYLQDVLAGYKSGIDGPWGIELTQTHQLIGAAHLMDIHPQHWNAEIGVVLHSGYWGQGLGSEALRAVLAVGFSIVGLERIQGLVITGNSPACRMLEKCGMTHEGLLRHYAWQKEQWCDSELYAILKAEFH
ncbi:MAG: GNAT family N-acetyltransferase [Anaerolineae bacterium]|nr:GNAT family N-acetyltransferase [Anaerolineae bacterium]